MNLFERILKEWFTSAPHNLDAVLLHLKAQLIIRLHLILLEEGIHFKD